MTSRPDGVWRHRWWAAPVLLLGIAMGCGRGSARTATPDARATAIASVVESLAVQGVFADARVVSFGETTHGTWEFRTTFYESVLRIARDESVLTAALELGPELGRGMNEWIEGCGSHGYNKRIDIRWFSSSTRRFMEQARQHNLTHKGCLRIVGVDAPVGPYTVVLMTDYAQSCLSPVSYQLLEPRLRELQAMSALFGTGDPRPRALLESIHKGAALSKRAEYCTEFDWWTHLASQHIEIKDPSARGFIVPEYVHTIDRDEIIASSVMFWAEGGEKVLLLAHAFHVAEVEIPAVRGGGKSTPAGVLLQRSLGEQYTSVELLFGEGTLFAIGCLVKGKGSIRHIPPPRRPSIQRDLLRDFSDPTLLSSRTACDGRNCSEVRSHVYCLPRGWRDPAVSYQAVDMENAFDWVVFFPTGTANVR